MRTNLEKQFPGNWDDELVELVRRRSLSVVSRRSLSVVRGRSLSVSGRHSHDGLVRRQSRAVSGKDSHNDLVHRDGQSLFRQQLLWLLVLLPVAMLLTIAILMGLSEGEMSSDEKARHVCPHCGYPK